MQLPPLTPAEIGNLMAAIDTALRVKGIEAIDLYHVATKPAAVKAVATAEVAAPSG